MSLQVQRFDLGNIRGTLCMRSHMFALLPPTKAIGDSFVVKNKIAKEGPKKHNPSGLGGGGSGFEPRRSCRFPFLALPEWSMDAAWNRQRPCGMPWQSSLIFAGSTTASTLGPTTHNPAHNLAFAGRLAVVPPLGSVFERRSPHYRRGDRF
jgi:hypothetical protein